MSGISNIIRELIYKEKYKKKDINFIRDNIEIEESLINDDIYLRIMLCVYCYHNDLSLFKKLYKDINLRDYLLSSLIMISGSHKVILLEDNINEFLEGRIDLDNLQVVNDEALRGIYRNSNFINKDLHPLLLPYLYIKFYRSILRRDRYKWYDDFINDILDVDIITLMRKVGMNNVTSIDNYDYFFKNIEYYNENSKSDFYYLRKNKVYYNSRPELIDIISRDKFLFIPEKIEMATNYNDYLDYKDMIAEGNFRKFKMIKIKSIIRNNDNIIHLCYLIKLLKRFHNNNFIQDIREKIKDKYSFIDENKSLNFYKRMFNEGMKIRGWKEGTFPKYNQETRYNCYITGYNTKINIDNCYLYHNCLFSYYGNNYDVTNPELLSKIYISTAIFYMINKYNYYIDGFSIYSMI